MPVELATTTRVLFVTQLPCHNLARCCCLDGREQAKEGVHHQARQTRVEEAQAQAAAAQEAVEREQRQRQQLLRRNEQRRVLAEVAPTASVSEYAHRKM